jgi:hypothetical protein
MILHTDTDWPPRRCSGESCRQGRAECKTPEACQLPEPADELRKSYWREAWTAAAVIAIVALVAVLA